MADTDLTAELDRIAAELRTFGANGDDTERLLAAVGAVLKLADNWSGPEPDAGRVERVLEAVLRECAAMIREAISREITGKGESGDGR